MGVYDEAKIRERKIWTPFVYGFRFSAGQVAERTEIFGLFSGSYLNNLGYLQDVDAYNLALIVDRYNQRMSELDEKEQLFLLDMVTKRYVVNIDRLILGDKLFTQRQRIDAEDEEWDAKIAALASDQAAVTTVQALYDARATETAARIETLDAAIIDQGMRLDFAESEISEKQLQVGRAEVANTIKDSQVIRKGAEIVTSEAALVQKDVVLKQREIELLRDGLRVLQLQLDEARGEQRILDTGLTVSKLQLQVIGGGMKALAYQREAAQTQIQTARIDKDIAQTAFITVDLANANIEKSVAEITSAEKDNQLAGVGVEISRTELRTREVATDFLTVDRQASGMRIEAARFEEKIAQTDILTAEAAAATARYDGALSSLALHDVKARIIRAREREVLAETNLANAQLGDAAAVHAAELQVASSRHEERMADAEYSLLIREAAFNERVTAAENDLQRTLDGEVWEDKLEASDALGVIAATAAARTGRNADLDAMDRVLSAQILTTLRHSIGLDT